jgi:hypothetical protein
LGQRELSAATHLGPALAADPDLVERLVAGDPVFARLRAVVGTPAADLLTLDDAACVAGIDVAVLLAVARDETPPASTRTAPATEVSARPDWVDERSLTGAVRLDVRPFLDRHENPIATVIELSSQVPPEGLFVLDCPFDPLPLRRLLIHRGFAAWSEQIERGHWRVWFLNSATAPADSKGARLWQQNGTPHIDVRGLAPPEPMLAIVRLLEAEDTGDRVVVVHEREPVYFYPELAERGWSYRIEINEPGLVRLSLSRGSA